MKLLIQWTRGTAADWVEIDSADWAATAFKAEPVGGEAIDDVDGWVYALCVQGVEFVGFDHYYVDHPLSPDTCRVTCWNDDPDDWPVGSRGAHVWTFPRLTPDANLGGAINTRQDHVVYADPELAVDGALPWGVFTPPTTSVRHGKWVSDEWATKHDITRSKQTWRSWTEGLDPSELDGNGLVKTQRDQGRYLVPDGTKTFFLNSPPITGVHFPLSANYRLMELVQGTPQTMFGGNLAINSDALYAAHATAAAEPNNAAWPTGNYRVQIDVSGAGAGLTWGYTTAGGSSGHFARVDSALNNDLETHQQIEALGSGTGIQQFTTGAVSWLAGALSDRFEVLLACVRDGVGHGNQAMQYLMGDPDAFADGPWNGVGQHPVFVGINH